MDDYGRIEKRETQSFRADKDQTTHRVPAGMRTWHHERDMDPSKDLRAESCGK